MKAVHAIIAMILLYALSACSVAPVHPSYEGMQLPRQLPVRDFVANSDHTGDYVLSPDGTKLAWIGVSRLKPAILWRFLDSSETHVAVRFGGYSPSPFWSADGRYLRYHDDQSGRENLHIYAVDTSQGNSEPRDLTPYENVRAFVQHVPTLGTSRLYVMHNRRDPAAFDLYEIDLNGGEERLLFENRETVISLPRRVSWRRSSGFDYYQLGSWAF